MSQPEDRRAIYADVLAGLRDLVADAPVGRFDALVDDLLAAGRLSADDAAALRFWQREALRNQADQLITTASATLGALDASRAATEESIRSAGRSWDRRAAAGPPDSGSNVEPTAEPNTGTTGSAGPRHAAPAPAAAPPAPAEPPASAVPPTRDPGRHRAADPTPPTTRLDLPLTPAVGSLSASDAASDQAAGDHEAGTPSARRRRLLVAGLTVIDEDGTNADDHGASGPLGPHPFDDRPAVG